MLERDFAAQKILKDAIPPCCDHCRSPIWPFNVGAGYQVALWEAVTNILQLISPP